VFGELYADLTKTLTLTLGARAFKADNSLYGFFGFGSGYSSRTGEAACFAKTSVAGSPCTNLNKRAKETGAIYKVNLNWQVADGKMLYATYSQGFRPGGINRRSSLAAYVADYLYNYELGWKTESADRTIRFNGAAFFEDWTDFQFSFLGPNSFTEIRNAGQARIKGLETELSWATPIDGLRLSGGAQSPKPSWRRTIAARSTPRACPSRSAASPRRPPERPCR